jgi:hypothetical protein
MNPSRPPGWRGSRVVDVLVYGIAAVFVGLGLLVLDSALLGILAPSSENRQSPDDPNPAGLLAVAAFAVVGGVATIVSRIRYVRRPPPLPPPDPAPVGLGRIDTGPSERQEHLPATPAEDVPEPIAAEATTPGPAAEIVGIALGAAFLTMVLLVVVPVAFAMSAAALGVGGGFIVAFVLLAAGGHGFQLLHRRGRPAPSVLSIADSDPVPERQTINPGLVIAGSVALTMVAMLALLLSICSSARGI